MSILIVLFLTLASYAAPSPRFCDRKNSDMHRELAEPRNRIEFKNGGGLLNGGVCWWHSRLQRSSLYLARFNPLRPKPNGAQIRGILSALKNMNQVVEIGGYANFYEFSKGEKPSIQSMLEAWQKEDGILYFQWIRGLSGKHRLPSGELEVRMDELAELVSSSPTPVWAMAQMKGITSHSFLIRTIEAHSNGYKLELIDSNSPADLRYAHYRRGDQSLRLVEGRNEFVLYPGFQTDFKKIKATLSDYCRWNPYSFLANDLFGNGPLIEGEIEPQDL